MTIDVKVMVEAGEVPLTPPEADVELPLGYGAVDELRILKVADVNRPEEYTCLLIADV